MGCAGCWWLMAGIGRSYDAALATTGAYNIILLARFVRTRPSAPNAAEAGLQANSTSIQNGLQIMTTKPSKALETFPNPAAKPVGRLHRTSNSPNLDNHSNTRG